MKVKVWRYVVGKKTIECPYCDTGVTAWSIVSFAYRYVNHAKQCEGRGA